MELNEAYWTHRYEERQTAWDIGQPSTPLKEYIDQLNDRSMRILIPGCGNGYEAKYFVANGFENLTLIDLSEIPVAALQSAFADRPSVRVLQGDFFDHLAEYDLVLEQTFFCALDPSYRNAYANKMKELLADGGTLAGVLFDRDFVGGPPFGGSVQEYRKLFEPLFTIKTLDACYNSISTRQGSEAFMILKNE